MNEDRAFPLPVDVTASEFEVLVADHIREQVALIPGANVEHLKKLAAPDGTYEIDVLLSFAIAGGDYKTLIECKRHAYPIKRDVVQILVARLRSLGAQKGMIYTTSSYQEGAKQYAREHGITLVSVTGMFPQYETRSLGGPIQPFYLSAWDVALPEGDSYMRRFEPSTEHLVPPEAEIKLKRED